MGKLQINADYYYSLDVLKAQLSKYHKGYFENQPKEENARKQYEMDSAVKDNARRGDPLSRRVFIQLIKTTLLDGFPIYECAGKNGEYRFDALLDKQFAITNSFNHVDLCIQFDRASNLSAREKYDIIMYKLSEVAVNGRNKDFKNLVVELESRGMPVKKVSKNFRRVNTRYEITKADISALYDALKIQLTFTEKMDIIAERMYADLYGAKSVDRLLYSDINELGLSADGKFIYVWDDYKVHMSFLEVSPTDMRMVQEKLISNDTKQGALNDSNPVVLCDDFVGNRVTVVQPPVFSARNVCVRMYNKNHLAFDKLVKEDRLQSLTIASVKTGQSCIFQGTLGAGKSTLMQSSYEILDPHLHIGLMEDMPELHILHKYGVLMRVVEAAKWGKYGLQEIVEVFLRMSLDVAGLGEARSGDALFSFIQLVQSVSISAWMTGQVNSPENTVPRLKNLLMGLNRYNNEKSAVSDIIHSLNMIYQHAIVNGVRVVSKVVEIIPTTETSFTGDKDIMSMSKDELELENLRNTLLSDPINMYRLNTIYEYDPISCEGRFMNYPSQKYVDRARRMVDSSGYVQMLLDEIEKDLGYKHKLNVWWNDEAAV